MLKKTALTLAVGFGLAASVSAADVDLSLFVSDFNALMNGVARDVAPSLRLGALSGDLQGDATIDHATFTFPGIGLVATNGLGRVLAPGAYDWEFVLPLADLINDNVPSPFFEKLMLYPAVKMAAGFGINTWDVTVSGMWFPQALVGLTSGVPVVGGLDPQFSFGNLGVQVRKTLIADSGWMVPALSLGTGISMTGFNFGLTLKSLEDLGIDPPSLGEDQSFDMKGDFGITTSSTVFTVDLQVSKHLLFFTPYAKLSGAYQNSTFTGNAAMKATFTDSHDPANITVKSKNLVAKPVVNVSDFAFLTTTGLEMNLFLVIFNINVVTDVSRAFLNVHSFSLTGIDGNAFSLNTGLRFAF